MLRFIPDIDAELARFREKYIIRIKPIYARMQKTDDMIISGSPADKHSGRILGAGCRGKKKALSLIS